MTRATLQKAVLAAYTRGGFSGPEELAAILEHCASRVRNRGYRGFARCSSRFHAFGLAISACDHATAAREYYRDNQPQTAVWHATQMRLCLEAIK